MMAVRPRDQCEKRHRPPVQQSSPTTPPVASDLQCFFNLLPRLWRSLPRMDGHEVHDIGSTPMSRGAKQLARADRPTKPQETLPSSLVKAGTIGARFSHRRAQRESATLHRLCTPARDIKAHCLRISEFALHPGRIRHHLVDRRDHITLSNCSLPVLRVPCGKSSAKQDPLDDQRSLVRCRVELDAEVAAHLLAQRHTEVNPRWGRRSGQGRRRHRHACVVAHGHGWYLQPRIVILCAHGDV